MYFERFCGRTLVRSLTATVLTFLSLSVMALGQPDSESIASGPARDRPASAAPDGDAAATRPDISWRLRMGSSQYGVELGFAPTQPTFFSGRKEYNTTGRQFAMASFRYGHIVGTRGPVTYQYLFEAIPMSLAIKNETMSTDGRTTRRSNTYAIGVEPIGFRFLFRPYGRLKPYIQTGAGFIFSSKPIPVPEGLPYNFIGDFGGGIMYSLSKTRAMNMGYRYFHISNMNLGKLNPGYNANIFYLGYSFMTR